jgi:thiol-disulfide isomerase/thioredoxin
VSHIKTLAFLTTLVLAFAALAAHAEVTGQQRAQAAGRDLLGTPAPMLVLKTIDGEAIDLGSLYGKKAVYLKFWATWCVPCRQQMPHFEHVYEAAGSDMAVIAIDVGFNDSIEAIRDYRKRLGITMPIVFDDGSLGTAFHLRVTPTHIVIGRDGRIQYVSHLADRDLDTALTTARTVLASHAQPKAIERKDPPPIGIGDLLPSQSLQTLDGQRFELRPNVSQRQLTALVFLSPWCESYLATTRPEVSAGCRNIREQISTLASDPRIRWIGIASGLWANRGDLREYRAHYQVSIPLTLDESGAEFRTFRVNDVPTILVADAQGRIVRRVDGGASKDAAALLNTIVGL